MFENAQQEENSGAGKIVGAVIAVVLVLLVGVYFLFLREEPAATAESPAAAASMADAAASSEPADPMKDLTILKFNLGRDQTQTMAMWDIQVSNRSRSVGYTNIQYATNYYNGQDAVIYHNEGTLSQPIGPFDQRTFSQINDGLYPVGTVRYTIELKGAQPVQ